jgi:PAS domain S-box-containing protein
MRGQPELGSWSQRFFFWPVILVAGWTVAIGVLLSWDFSQIGEQALHLAVVRARTSHDRDLAFRRWAARHGGVYVPQSELTPPNPFLAHVPERDLTTPSGRSLTLMNSAYISRQITEWFEKPGGTKRHVTSLRPLRPENAPDPWEADALRSFEQGMTEVVSQSAVEGRDHLRFMKPMVVEPECLKCHAAQGYRVGDIRGGISVSVPMESYVAAAGASQRFAILAYSGVWLIGVAGIGAVGLRVSRRARVQRASDLALLESERKFRAMFNQSFHLAGVLSPDGTILDINDCALEFAGIRREEVVGKPFWDGPWWTHDADASDRVRAAIKLAAQEGSASRFSTSHRDRSGTLREIDFSLRPVKDDRGRTLMLVPEGMDVTESKRAEAERAALSEKLLKAQKLESIGRLAGGVAHDFNNLLSPVLGYADLLLAGAPEGSPNRAALEAIIDAATKAKGLTQQLLTCAHRHPTESRPTDLNDVVREFEQTLRRTLRDNIAIELRLAPSVLPVDVDPRKIGQVLLNLAVNAQDAMEAGGRLTITTSEVVLDAVAAGRCDGLPPGPYVCMSVADNGAGMSKSTLERLFEPFFTTKGSGKGTGLGLAIVYGVVKQHGGHVEVRSAPGEGTTFDFYFPRTDRPIERVAGQTVEPSQGGNETILVVDDDNAVRRMVCGMLENHGYKVIEAADGPSAIEAAARHGAIELLISDVLLSGMGARAIYEKVALHHARLAVLYMSGWDADVMGGELPVEGTAGFIQKPFSLDGLAAKVRSILDARKRA